MEKMTQSELLKRVKAYQNSPYRKEYDKEFSATCTDKPILWYLINLGYLFFLAVFIFLGWVFFTNDSRVIEIEKKIADILVLPFMDVLLIIGLGIANIWLGINFIIASSQWKDTVIADHNEKRRKALACKYAKKGVYRYVENDLWKHSCCEYDHDYGRYVCCITKKPLSRAEHSFCSVSGNCSKCKTFMGAYLGEHYVNTFMQ